MLTIFPEPPTWQALLGFDLDGTLLLSGEDPPLDPRFFESVRWVRANYGAVWGICTGRSLPQLIEGFNEGKFVALPDFVVVREREIYFPGQFGRWLPHDDWNRNCEKEHARLFRKSRRFLGKVRKLVEAAEGARWVSEEGDPAGIVADDVAQLEELVHQFEALQPPPKLSFERNGIYLRFSHADFNKGTALRELGDYWGVGTDKTLAVGDNFNDLNMFQQGICEALGCPANAVQVVRDFVHQRGGIVAEKKGSAGVIEILGRYFDP
ncbi:MAG: HAD family hydrolase [Verrucomicrobiales bacterium]